MERKGLKRYDVSNHQGPSVHEGQSTFVHERGNKRKGTYESDAVPKRPKVNAKTGPSEGKGRQKATRSSATRKVNTGQVDATHYGKPFPRSGAGRPESWRHMSKISTGPSKPVARPMRPRSGAEPIAADDGQDEDQPLTSLPDANLRKPKR